MQIFSKSLTFIFFVSLITASFSANAKANLKVGDTAPVFKATTHEGKEFDLASRKGTWTVLFFYPKAGTPGCTTQACAFRDSVKVIRQEGADVFGVSADTVTQQAAFQAEHKLNFLLIADPDHKIIESFGSKMPLIGMSKRWTFILDPELKIRAIEKDVDPATDAKTVAALVKKLKS